MSSLLLTSFASPFFIRLLVHIFHHLKISPGIANKSFQLSSPSLAVIRLPDLSFASTIKIPFDNQATISFLTGKL